MKLCNKWILNFLWLSLILKMIYGEGESEDSSEDLDKKWPHLPIQQSCVTHDKKPGTCRTLCPNNLMERKSEMCREILFPRCCPNTNSSSLLGMNSQNSRVACGIRPNSRGYLIVGGTESMTHSWPWAAAVFQIKYDSIPPRTRFMCGGTIINEKYVLTAAHCIVRKYEILQPKNFKILIGAHQINASGFFSYVSEVKVHENYASSQHINDIALFKLSQPINFNIMRNIRPICLPKPEMDKYEMQGQMAQLVGWGTTSEGGKASAVLQEVTVPITDTKECARSYKNLLKPGDQVSENQICAGYPEGGRDSCQGDSGGSLTVPFNNVYYQFGIVSFGKGCAQKGFPGVYTRVSRFIHWLETNIQN